MKKYILDCLHIRSDGDFWDLYCEVVQPEGVGYFGKNLDAFWDAVSADGPGWPGNCQLELVNVDGFMRLNPQLYSGLKRIATALGTSGSVRIMLPDAF